MTEATDLRYFIDRECRARKEALAATDISVRIAHLAAADGYAARIVHLRMIVRAAA